MVLSFRAQRGISIGPKLLIFLAPLLMNLNLLSFMLGLGAVAAGKTDYPNNPPGLISTASNRRAKDSAPYLPNSLLNREYCNPWFRRLSPPAAILFPGIGRCCRRRVAFLAGGWKGDGPLDLSRAAGRCADAAVGPAVAPRGAGRARRRGPGARRPFPPRVLTPDRLIAQGLGPDVASQFVSLLAWTEIFRTFDPGAFREVFPVDPPARNFSWALRLAQEFARLQAMLAEAGLRLADVNGMAGEDFCETARWQQLERT